MLICGQNHFFQLGEKSNNGDSMDKYINPAVKSRLNPNSIISYSTYYHHSVVISRDGIVYISGDNSMSEISKSLPQLIFNSYVENPILDTQKNSYVALSAVCTKYYTVYLVLNPSNNNAFQLYFHNQFSSCFLNTYGRNPIALFGGSENAASINSDGSIVAIVLDSEKKFPLADIIVLPENEKASSVACTNHFFIVLSMSGKLYHSSLKGKLSEVDELKGTKIVYISGTYYEAYAVSEKGQVFRFGNDMKNKFTLIHSLLEYKIDKVYAGSYHSFFLTSDGKLLGLGKNSHGELFINNNGHEIVIPTEISILMKEKVLFCCAGYDLSVISTNNSIRMSPNKKITNYSKISEIVEQIKAERKKKSKIDIFEQEKKNIHQNEPIKIIDSETIHNLKIIREISSGGNGKILEVENDQKYALKVMHTNDLSVEKVRSFIGEQEKLQILNHPNIIHTHGIYFGDEENPLSILLELCTNDLKKVVKSNSLNNVKISTIVYQIVEAMRYVHYNKIIHRDLKPMNILFGSDGLIRISDFGISKLMTVEEQTTTTFHSGTMFFMAPEILNQEKYDEKIDVYSFGVLLFYILTGGEMPKITVVQIGNGKKAAIPNSFTKLSRDLINCCWNFDPKHRPSFSDILDLLDKNDYKVVDLNSDEINEVHRFITEYKKLVPTYIINKIQQMPLESQELVKKIVKIIMVGASGTGKTSFNLFICKGYFSEFTKFTIGYDISIKDIQWNDKLTISVQLWDINGNEIYGNSPRLYFQESTAALVFIDNRYNFDIAKRWKDIIDENVCTSDKKKIPCLLVINKSDLDESNMNEQIKEFVAENNFIDFICTSCRNGTNIKESLFLILKYIMDNNIEPYIQKDEDEIIQESQQNKKNCCIY